MSVYLPRFSFLFLILVVQITIVNSVFSEENTSTELRLAYVEFPPFFSTDSQGNPVGSIIDLARLILKRSGIKWRATSYPAKRMVANIVHGQSDLWIGLSTFPAFKEKVIEGPTVVDYIELRSYKIGNKKVIKKFKDLEGHSVVTLRGYSYGGKIKYLRDPSSNIKVYSTDRHTSAFKMLRAQRAEYLLDYKGPSEGVLKKMKISGLQYDMVSKIPIRFVVSKKNPKAQEIIDKLEKSYHDLVKENVIQRAVE